MNQLKEEIKMKDKGILSLFILYFILKPFYLWGSGLPQIADIVMILFIFIYFIKNRMILRFNNDSKKLIIVGLIFIVHVLIVNLFWMFTFSETSRFLLASAMFIYNYLIFFMMFCLYSEYEERIIEITFKAMLASVILQLLILVLSGGLSGGRAIGGFNNPNQLGYYSLLALSIFLFTSRRIKVKTSWVLVGIFASSLLCFASLSKAAIISYLGMLFFYAISRSNKDLRKKIIVVSLALYLLLTFTYKINSELITSNGLYKIYTSVERRVKSIGTDSDDSLDGRGYYRIKEYPQYWILGAGEGKYTRFRNESLEFHSTLGNIQVSYGIVGLSLFLSILYLALKKNGFKNWYLIVFILVYGLTHNGIRNSLFWILIAFVSFGGSLIKNDEEIT